MRYLPATSSLSTSTLTIPATCQDDVETFDYCDDLDRCFNAYSVPDTGVTFGLATPEDSAEGFGIILQVTGEIASAGWVGLSWGGAMTYNPLAIVWPNGEDVTISSRIALYARPLPPATRRNEVEDAD